MYQQIEFINREEKIEYFRTPEERNLNSEIVDYTERIKSLGKQKNKIEKSKRLNEIEKDNEIKTIENEAKYYISKINNATRLLYGGTM